jgi:hypothetical protein
MQENWQEVFADSCTGDWQKQWFLDGDVASVSNDKKGMQLTAGPKFLNDAHHMVLWTKESFRGDVKIEYEFTRNKLPRSRAEVLKQLELLLV